MVLSAVEDKEWDRNNFPIGITIEYSTTGQAGGYWMDSAKNPRTNRLLHFWEVIMSAFLTCLKS
jgi:hypothetical protein